MELSQVVLGLQISNYMEEFHHEDIPDAKFKIGEVVKYVGVNPSFLEYKDKYFSVKMVNYSDEIEYGMVGFPFLVWESELEKVEINTVVKCKYCAQWKKKFEECPKCGSNGG